MEKTVKGATKIKLAAPKSKYIEPILAATRHGDTGVADVFNTLQLRLRDSTWTIVFKALLVVHLMIREGAPDITLRFLADSPKRLAISQFAEAQTQGLSIRRYFEYLLEKVKAYQDVKTDFVRAGTGRMRSLTVDKGLLRQTELVQAQIRALLKCDLGLTGSDVDNEISVTAFRLLTLDLLELFKVMNEGTINVLEHYFEMSKVDAKRALGIYKTFGRQTDAVVNYLSTARQFQAYTRLEVPRLKHAPTTLTSSLEDYLNDPDFEINRRQYLAQQEAKKTGKPAPPAMSVTSSNTKTAVHPSSNTSQSRPEVTAPPARGPAPDLIDFFESIDQNQQPMAQANIQQQSYGPVDVGQSQYQQQQLQQMMPQQTGYNPFATSYGPQTPQQPQQLQPDFTGAGFGGYGPQPAQQIFGGFGSSLAPIPQGSVADFSAQGQQQPQPMVQSPQALSPQGLQPQATGTNPFRQSMLPTGNVQSFVSSNPNRQSTNPFAKQDPGAAAQSAFDANNVQQTQPFLPMASPQALQPQKTGTNPFAKQTLSPPPAMPLAVNVTGSTNPFRQSQFVNQQTGQGWQHSTQGTFAGYDINNVPTTSIFPRPGAQQT